MRPHGDGTAALGRAGRGAAIVSSSAAASVDHHVHSYLDALLAATVQLKQLPT